MAQVIIKPTGSGFYIHNSVFNGNLKLEDCGLLRDSTVGNTSRLQFDKGNYNVKSATVRGRVSGFASHEYNINPQGSPSVSYTIMRSNKCGLQWKGSTQNFDISIPMTKEQFSYWSGVCTASGAVDGNRFTPHYNGSAGDYLAKVTGNLNLELVLELEEGNITNLSPANVFIDATKSNVFRWQYNKAGGGLGTQKSAKIEYKNDEKGAVKVVDVIGSTQSYDFPAYTFEYSEKLLWRVQVTAGDDTVTECDWVTVSTMLPNKAYANNIEPNGFNGTTGQDLNFKWQLYSLSNIAQQYSYRIEISKDNINWQLLSEGVGDTQQYAAQKQTIAQGTWYWRIRLNTNLGYTDWSPSKSFKLTGTPYISNIILNGEYWEKPIEVNWRSEYQSGYEVECYQNNILKTTLTGTMGKVLLIPIGTFTSKNNCSIRLRIYNTVEGINIYTDWQERQLSLKDIVAMVDGLALSGSNIDLQLAFSWDSTGQQKYEVEIYKDTGRIKTFSGITDNKVIFAPSIFTTGLHKFRVRVAYKDQWTEWKEINATLVETLPSISLLEPDGIIAERDENIRVWWISNNQSRWKIVIDNTLSYEGTTEIELTLPPAILQTGNHKIFLTVTYITPSNVEKKISKTAEFIVQGKPPIPTIINDATVNTSRPTIVWDTQDQEGFIIDVLQDKEVIYTSEWQNGLLTRWKVQNYLSNGSYTIRVKIINKYSLESDWGVKPIVVDAAEEAEILLIATFLGNHTELKWDNSIGRFMDFYVLRDNKVIANTKDTLYKDYTCHSTSVYTIRGITAADAYKDSNNCLVESQIEHGIIATIDKLYDVVDCGLARDAYNFTASIGLETTNHVVQGREKPIVVYGEHTTNTYTLTFTQKDYFKFLNMCNLRQVFCYRDRYVKLYLSINSVSYKIDKFGLTYSANTLEIDYEEVIEYD